MAIRTNGFWRWFGAGCAAFALNASVSGQEPPPVVYLPPSGGVYETPTTTTAVPTVQPPQVVEGAGAAPCPCEAAGKPKCGCEGCDVDWSKVPPIFPVQRPGNFPVPGGSGPRSFFLVDQIRGITSAKPPKFPFGPTSLNPTSFFNYDFRYLDNPDNQQTDWSDFYKRVKFWNDCWLFSTGGEIRYQYRNEQNSRLRGVNNNFGLLRTRLYSDLWYKDRLRFFVEGIYAGAYNENLRPLPIDDTGVDLLNAFVELKLGTIKDAPVYVRGGRQEMTFGSQRLISSLDWANTRRTFQGVRGYRHGKKVDTDLFWVQPVIPDPNQFDSVASDLYFSGMFNTYKIKPGTGIDFYVLNLRDDRPATDGDVLTVGGRFFGDWEKKLLWDLEAGGQTGSRAGLDVGAAFATAGMGWRFTEMPWNPTVWAYYDYASGDANPNDGDAGTFNQLFPFGHYYLGFIDLVARQNIHDLNFHLITNPQPWLLAAGPVPRLQPGQPHGHRCSTPAGRRLPPTRPGRRGPWSATSWTSSSTFASLSTRTYLRATRNCSPVRS